MPKVVARTAFEYPPGQHRNPGDEFEVEERHVRILVAIGRIDPPGGYRTTAIESAPKKKRNRESLLATVRR